MEEFEPKKKIKIFTKEFYIKYSYVFIIAIVLFIGTSFGLTFFTQNLKIATGSLTTAPLNITLSNNSINATGLSVPTTNQEGLSEYVKTLTITNNGTTDGIVKLTLDRTSGLNLTDMSYALIVNGGIQVIDNVPSDGVIFETAIMGNEVIEVELRLWPKTTYTGSETTFVGEIDSEIRYLGEKASNQSNLTNAYVNFNCQGNNCETWRIVGTQSGRLILTRDEDLEGATNRTDSGKYNSSLTFNDNSMITSVSTDNKNVYLAKTVKIESGEETQANPYTLINSIEREPDKKIIATITYKDNNNTTVGTQYIYHNETNYISQELSDSGFQGWTDGTNNYSLGDVVNFTSDTILDAVIQMSAISTITANAITPTNPINFANESSSSNGEGLYILPGTESNTNPIYYYRGAVTNNNVIFGDYCWQMVRTTDTGGIKMIYNGVITGNGETCENTAHADRIISSSSFNSQYNTVTDVGYMKNNNARYTPTSAAGETGAVYGKKVEWDGNNYLVIEDTANTASTNTTKDNYHHYTCGTAGTTSCPSVRYYYYNNYYITLTSGDFVEDAIYKMTGSIVNQDIDVVTRNPGYVLNNADSTIKTAIESWFRTNLTNEVDNTKRNFVSYLEDTVYCNDRGVKTVSGNTSYPTYQESGWNPSGGDLTKYLYFGTWDRNINNWYSTSNVPSTACPNETDRFSVGSSVAHLNYPVGLLTADEIVMAGASGNSNTSNNTYYLYTGGYYWSLSPNAFRNGSASEFYVSGNGYLGGSYVDYAVGLRPVISLNSTVEFETGGDGTPTNPYVVKYE